MQSFTTKKQTAKERAAASPIGIYRAQMKAFDDLLKDVPQITQEHYEAVRAIPKEIVHPRRNSPLQRSSTPIRKVGKNRAAQMHVYTVKKKQFMKAHPTCEAQVTPCCTHYSDDLHHKAGRVGVLLIAPSGFLAVCRNCHNWIHSHPSEARKLGLLK